MNENKLFEVERLKNEVFGSVQQLKTLSVQVLSVSDCLVRMTHSVRNLGVQFDAEMATKSHVIATFQESDGIWQQHRQNKSYVHLLQADSMLAASEANTTAPESTELGSPFDRRRHEL